MKANHLYKILCAYEFQKKLLCNKITELLSETLSYNSHVITSGAQKVKISCSNKSNLNSKFDDSFFFLDYKCLVHTHSDLFFLTSFQLNSRTYFDHS